VAPTTQQLPSDMNVDVQICQIPAKSMRSKITNFNQYHGFGGSLKNGLMHSPKSKFEHCNGKAATGHAGGKKDGRIDGR